MPGIEFYYAPMSAPCRSVFMLLKGMGLKFEKKEVNLMTGDHKKEDYLKINPCHTVPTLVDDGFNLWESRAILIYLCEKHGGESPKFYPKDAKTRGCINRMLYFDMGTLYKVVGEWLYPQLFKNADPDAEKWKAVEEKLGMLDKCLGKFKYVAGDELSIADFACVSTVTFLEVKEADISKFKNVCAWVEKLKSELPYFAECNEGLYQFRDQIKSK